MDAPILAAAPAAAPILILLNVVGWALLLATALFWFTVVAKWQAGMQVLPFEPRRPVPWTAGDLAVIFVFHVFVSIAFVVAAKAAIGVDDFSAKAGEPGEVSKPASLDGQADDEQQSTRDGTELLPEDETAHDILRLVSDGGVLAWLVATVSVVIVAPLAEEFVFRLLMIGWLEKIERRWRRITGRKSKVGLGQGRTASTGSRGWYGAGSIGLSSAVFASLHARQARAPEDADALLALLAMVAANAAIWIATLALGLLVIARHRLTLHDLGIVPKKMLADVRLGLLTLLGVFLPVMAVQLVLKQFVFPPSIAPDPIALFLLAVALGVLYVRTHRIIPCITLHAGFNLANLLIAILATFAG